MSTRLSTIDPALAEALQRLSPARLSDIARMAARWAVEQSGLDEPLVAATLSDWAAGRTQSSKQMRRDTQELADRLDEIAWEVQDGLDSGIDDGAEYETAFARARAATAVCYALSEDPVEAALEAVYEAYAVKGSLEELRDKLQMS